MAARSVKELLVHQKSYALAMEVFRLTKRFPTEEKYGLSSQVRRCSRSVALNLREAWAKRRYQAHFVSKLTDCDGQNSELDTCLDFALDCGYLNSDQHQTLTSRSHEVGRMLGSMINHPEKFILKTDP